MCVVVPYQFIIRIEKTVMWTPLKIFVIIDIFQKIFNLFLSRNQTMHWKLRLKIEDWNQWGQRNFSSYYFDWSYFNLQSSMHSLIFNDSGLRSKLWNHCAVTVRPFYWQLVFIYYDILKEIYLNFFIWFSVWSLMWFKV